MALKNKRKPKKCSVCMSSLEGQNIRIGCCDDCVQKAVKKLKRRVALGALFGAALVAAYCLFIYYAKANHVISDTMPYKGDVVLPTFFGYITFNGRMMLGLMNQSMGGHLAAAAILFLLPFGAFIQLKTQTSRHDSQEHAAKLDPFAGRMIAGAQYHRMDDIGLFVLSALFFLISGPVFFVYRLYKLAQLSRHQAAMDA